MKKLASLVMTLALILGMVGTALAAQSPNTVNKIGIVKGFTETSVTLGIDGKNYTYTIDKTTKVLLNDVVSTIKDAANKGVKAKIKLSGNKLVEINFNEIGEQQQGALEITATYPREMTTDTNTDVTFANSDKKEIGEEEDNVFGYLDSKTVTIGAVSVVPGTLKVVLNGKELKVIEGSAKFDAAVAGDEVQMVTDETDKSRTNLSFEAPITDNTTAIQEDIEKILSVSYKKKIYSITTSEIFKYCVDEDVYSEINGKEATLPKVLNRSTYAYIVMNPNGSIIYINSFYKDLQCTVDKIESGKITISVNAKGRTPFTDTLIVSPAVTVIDEKGNEMALGDLTASDTIMLNVDPYDNYRVISITRK